MTNEEVTSLLTKPRNTTGWSSAPLVSFLVPTFGRASTQPEMMDEVIGWCCNQTYPNTEVVILNDAPNQDIWIDTKKWPHVRVYNWPYRLPDLGTKRNILTTLAAGDICLPADDDDISLPNRAEQAVRYLDGYEFWAPMMWVYDEDATVPISKIDRNGWGYTSSAYRRASMLGRHEPLIKLEDAAAIGWARENLRFNKQVLADPNHVSYVYRWGVSPTHMSGQPDMIKAWGQRTPGPTGRFEIQPALTTDWELIARHAAGSFVSETPNPPSELE